MDEYDDTNVEYPPGCEAVEPSMPGTKLIPRLKNLANALNVMERNDSKKHPFRFRSLAKHLASSGFMHHRSHDVKLHVALCLTNILRIWLPSMPYSDEEKAKEVLFFIVDNFKGLENPSSTMYSRHFYLLEQLVYSDVLGFAADLPEDLQQDVVVHVFRTCFDIAAKLKPPKSTQTTDDDADQEDSISKRIIALMSQLLGNLITDRILVSERVLDFIFFYLISPQKMNLPNCYSLSHEIVKKTATTLTSALRRLCVTACKESQLPDDFILLGSKMSRLYQTICELHSINADIVLPTLYVFVSQLSSDNELLRWQTTKMIGILLQQKNSRIPAEQPDLFKFWLQRFRDVSVSTRKLCMEQGYVIALRHYELREGLQEHFMHALCDLEESARIYAVCCIVDMMIQDNSTISKELCEAVTKRLFDKKLKVREATTTYIMQLHRRVISNDKSTRNALNLVIEMSVRTLCLYLCAVAPEDKIQLEHHFVCSFVPYTLPVQRRVETACMLYSKCNKIAASAMEKLIAVQASYRKQLKEVLTSIKLCSKAGKEEQEILKKKIMACLGHSSHGQETNPKIAAGHRLIANTLATDKVCCDLLEYAIMPGYTCKKVEENIKTLHTRMDVAKKSSEDKCETRRAVRSLLERSLPLQVDNEFMEVLTRYILELVRCEEAGDTRLPFKVADILPLWRVYGKQYASCLVNETTVPIILQIMQCDATPVVEAGAILLVHVAEMASMKPSAQSWCNEAISLCKELALSRTGRTAKYCLTALCKLLGREKSFPHVMELVKTSFTHLSIDDLRCVPALQILGKSIRAFTTELRDEVYDKLCNVIIPDIVLSPVADTSGAQLDDELNKETCPSIVLAKFYGMRCLGHFFIAVRSDDCSRPFFIKTLELLSNLVREGGSVHKAGNFSQFESAWLRAGAASVILRLAYVQKYAVSLSATDRLTLALLLLDDYKCVREFIAQRIFRPLKRMAVPIHLAGMFVLAPLLDAQAQEKTDYESIVRTYLNNVFELRCKYINKPNFDKNLLPYHKPELCLAYAIHYLANYPAYKDPYDVDILNKLANCLAFLIDIFTSDEGKYDCALLTSLLQAVKDSNDSTIESDAPEQKNIANERLWVLADLSMAILSTKAKRVLTKAHGKPLPFVKSYFDANDKNLGMKLFAPKQLVQAIIAGKFSRTRKRGNQTSFEKSKSSRQTKTDSDPDSDEETNQRTKTRRAQLLRNPQNTVIYEEEKEDEPDSKEISNQSEGTFNPDNNINSQDDQSISNGALSLEPNEEVEKQDNVDDHRREKTPNTFCNLTLSPIPDETRRSTRGYGFAVSTPKNRTDRAATPNLPHDNKESSVVKREDIEKGDNEMSTQESRKSGRNKKFSQTKMSQASSLKTQSSESAVSSDMFSHTSGEQRPADKRNGMPSTSSQESQPTVVADGESTAAVFRSKRSSALGKMESQLSSNSDSTATSKKPAVQSKGANSKKKCPVAHETVDSTTTAGAPVFRSKSDKQQTPNKCSSLDLEAITTPGGSIFRSKKSEIIDKSSVLSALDDSIAQEEKVLENSVRGRITRARGKKVTVSKSNGAESASPAKKTTRKRRLSKGSEKSKNTSIQSSEEEGALSPPRKTKKAAAKPAATRNCTRNKRH